MKKIMELAFFLWLLAIVSCEENACCSRQDSDQLKGAWLLYEVGYSPGDQYVTKDVPADPPQQIVFHENNTLTSNIDGLVDYKFFMILEDNGGTGKILALFKQLPKDAPDDLHKLEHSYGIERKGNDMKLYYRFCIEGCHMAFKQVQE